MNIEQEKLSDEYPIIIAIDFGTSRSGFSYMFRGIPEESVWMTWINSPNPYAKNLSDLYINSDKDVFWGWDALVQYGQERSKAESSGFYYRNYKLALKDAKYFNDKDEPLVVPFGANENDKSLMVSVVDIISRYLSCISTYAVNKINDRHNTSYEVSDVLWCITVPATWRDVDKHWMREAATRAGMIGSDKEERRRLVFSLEPEAAAVAVHGNMRSTIGKAFDIGDTFMIFDAGGGTIDISSYVVEDDKTLAQLQVSSGSHSGSTFVDRYFVDNYMGDHFGDALMEYSHQDPLGYIKIMGAWERAKCSFALEGKGRSRVELPSSFMKYLEESHSAVYLRLQEDGVIDRDDLLLTKEDMRRIHEDAVSNAVNEAVEHLGSLKNREVDYIFPVGGFSLSPVLIYELKKRISEYNADVSVYGSGENAAQAVVSGAVMYVFNPEIIGSRMSALTYGQSKMVEYDSNLHPTSRKRGPMSDGVVYCTGVFDEIVAKGGKVPQGMVYHGNRTIILESWVSSVDYNINLFASEKTGVKYVDDDGARKIAELEFKDIPVTKGKYPSVEVLIYFGDTEISVSAKDRTTDKEVDTKIRFLTSYFEHELES